MVRVVVVSNRLPVTINPDRAPPNDVEQSSGGLVSALRSVVDDYSEVVWIGWPGSFVSSEAEERRMSQRIAEASTDVSLRPVWLSKEDVEDFYNGFSNSSLWPLLHWMTPYARFRKSWAERYRRVNQCFADEILKIAEPEDLIWVHDYHLFMVPQLLRRRSSDRGSCESSPKGAPELMPQRPKDLPPPLSPTFRDAQEAPAKSDARFVSMDLDPTSFHMEDSGDSQGVSKKDDQRRVSFSKDPDVAAVRSPSDGIGGRLRVAFFLHTPFPSFEMISVLPNCVEIVEGMLGADLIGFHTYNYLRHYRSCVTRLCGFTPEMDTIDHRGRRTKLSVFPIGANWQDFHQAMKTEQFTEKLQELTNEFKGKNVVLSVERLDYTKGMPQKLDAIQRYLEEAHAGQKHVAEVQEDDEEAVRERADRLEELQRRFEERKHGSSGMKTSFKHWIRKVLATETEDKLDHSKTVFVFVAVPSRQNVEEYKNIKDEVHKRITDVSGQFSTGTYSPIKYLFHPIDLNELAALYARADCCLVTPLVDGMNLVAKEFIAAKDRSVPNVVPGTIVLSEFAGAAQELFDALVVNPYDEDAVAEAIYTGLELTRGSLDKESRWELTERMRAAVLQNDAVAWARGLLQELQVAASSVPPVSTSLFKLLDFTAACFWENAPGTKALFLDLDVTFQDTGQATETSQAGLSVALLHRLNSRSDLKVYILSAFGKDFIEERFGHYNAFTLIADSGLHTRNPAESWERTGPCSAMEWMDKVRPVMELSVRCTPGAKMDVRASSVAWHYRDCDEEYGRFKAKELVHQLALSIGNLPCQVCQGDKVVEVISLHAKKGLMVQSYCMKQELDLGPFSSVFCMGGSADESVFVDATAMAYTVKIGPGDTRARHRFEDIAEAQRFIELVADQQLPGNMSEMGSDTSISACAFKSIDERKNSVDTADDVEDDPFANFQEHESPET